MFNNEFKFLVDVEGSPIRSEMVVGAWLFASLWTLAHCGDERPQFHFNFLQDNSTDIVNDPNGPRYIDGLYHLFFQHRRLPSYTEIAHATSPDLLHWTMAPRAALEPDEPYDDAGVWSGNSFELPDGRVGMAYRARSSRAPTAAGVAVAIADDGVAGNWTKRGVLFPKATCDALPIWRSNAGWRGGGVAVDGATPFATYSSADFTNWTEDARPLFDATRDAKNWPGMPCFCPDFYPSAGPSSPEPSNETTWVVKLSAGGKPVPPPDHVLLQFLAIQTIRPQ